MNDMPVIACYISDAPDGPYLVIATDTYSGAFCGLGHDALGFYAAIGGAPALWYYRISVVY